MGPFETKSQVQITQKISNDEAITDINDNLTWHCDMKKDHESSEEEEEPIQEGDHKARISKTFNDRKKKYTK
jgi:hypothetical protein